MVLSVAISGDGQTALSTADKDMRVWVWDLATGKCRARLTGHTGEVRCVAVSADGRTAVSGGKDFTVLVWDLVAGWGSATRKWASLIAMVKELRGMYAGQYDCGFLPVGPVQWVKAAWGRATGRCRAALRAA